MPTPLFWLFATLVLFGGTAVICLRNPVSSAMSVVACFVGLAGLFVGLSAFFVGIIQILVYTGAIMVLFLFIIMLLDLKEESSSSRSLAGIAAGMSLVVAFVIQLIGVLGANPDKKLSEVPLDQETLSKAAADFPKDSAIAKSLEASSLPDVHLIGHTLFTQYNLPLQILGVLLLVATIGVVALSKKGNPSQKSDEANIQ
ncbi:MAG: NADH-quinone oxidoreductase subunit J [Akkermansiaceae bacterium]|nr:NADH-quinone oxidoreductase subunit J [Akkermansiaceae bacterium]